MVACIAALVLAGWALDIDVLKSLLHPDRIAMNPATAICLLMCGAALWLVRHEPPTAAAKHAAQLLGAAVTAVAVARLLGYALDWQDGIDQFFFRARLAGNFMAPNTATTLLLVGLALLVLDDRTPRGDHPAQVLVFAAAGVALFSLAGYLYSSCLLYTSPSPRD